MLDLKSTWHMVLVEWFSWRVTLFEVSTSFGTTFEESVELLEGSKGSDPRSNLFSSLFDLDLVVHPLSWALCILGVVYVPLTTSYFRYC